MSEVLKVFLSMSFSGALLILALLAGKRFWKDRVSRQWQYYIWLVVVVRLLLPFTPETNLMGTVCQAVDRMSAQTEPSSLHEPGRMESLFTDPEQPGENDPVEDPAGTSQLQAIGTWLAGHIWIIWLTVALGLLIRKVTIYQSFIRYIHAGSAQVSDTGILDQLSIAAERAGVREPVELWIDPLVSSPLLIGVFRPCIVLPGTDVSEADFPYIFLHELTHWKRRDVFYKWLVQVAVCLHWFNPFVHWMSREVTRACEFSCDEAVLIKMGTENAQDYGRTLLDAMAAAGKYKENLGAITLSENKQLLKERLGAIMIFRRRSRPVRLLTGVLTLCVIFGASFVGLYPAAEASDQPPDAVQISDKRDVLPASGKANAAIKEDSAQAERYYEAGSLPLFQITFSRLNEKEQTAWLEKLYTNGDFAFFSVAVQTLEEDDPLLAAFAEKAYEDNEIAFFSILADRMEEAELELWLDRALEDGMWSFQSMLFDRLDMEDEKDALDEELAEKQMEEYRAAGVTIDGKNYYYQGKLVNIFLDIRPNRSFYTLDLNPKGTVNVKIIRGEDGQITGAAYMTGEEVAELLEDIDDSDEDDWDDPEEVRGVGETVSIPVDIERVKDGEYVWLGTYTLNEGDRVRYDITAGGGKQLDVGFARPGQSRPAVRYKMVSCRDDDGAPAVRTGAMAWRPPLEPGEYSLFIHTEGGTLTNVKGSVAIIETAADGM